MSDVKRYDMIAVTRCGEGWQELQLEPEGDWMLHEDHARIVAEKDAEIQRLREAILKFWADQCGNRACGCDEWPECTHTMAAFELHAVAHPPQQVSSACGHQRHDECHFAACVCECHNPPEQKDGE